MTNGNNLVDLNAEHLSEEAQVVLEHLNKNTNGNVATLVGEVVMNLEITKLKGNEGLVQTLEEIKMWLIPTIVAHVQSN